MVSEVNESKLNRYWGLIPAAGIGQRMAASIPKQFMKLGEKTLLERTVESLASHEKIEGIYIGLSADCERSEWVKSLHPKVIDIYEGGASRAETVLNGTRYLLENGCSESDWILVHDSNRPFLSLDEISSLLSKVGEDLNGGILSEPIHDTVKLGSSSRISKTLPRGEIFRAQTPQMFKIGILNKALTNCLQSGIEVTDEAQAVELLGYHPILVRGSASNIKITTADDMNMAHAMVNL